MLGFSTADLDLRDTNVVGGQAQVWKPRSILDVDIRIGGQWYGLLEFVFAEKTPVPILGRDLIFREFKLRMEAGETDLRPKQSVNT